MGQSRHNWGVAAHTAHYARSQLTIRKSQLTRGSPATAHPGGQDAAKHQFSDGLLAGLKSSEDELTRLGYSVQMCLTDFGETAEAVVQNVLKRKPFDCILIGAGVRTNPSNFILFEKLVNVVHEHAPQAKLCFNTLPTDTAAAVKRWI